MAAIQETVTTLWEELLQRGALLRIKVTGRSMAPFLRNGDVVTVSKVAPATVCIGDIIFFKTLHGAILLHRVVKKMIEAETWVFHTKGDALRFYDQPVLAHQVLGRVCQIETPHPFRPAVLAINMDCLSWRIINGLIAYGSQFLGGTVLSALIRLRVLFQSLRDGQ